MESIFPAFNAAEAEVLGQLPERRLRDLTASLRRVVERLEELDLDARVHESA